jgi:hypothetical protein
VSWFHFNRHVLENIVDKVNFSVCGSDSSFPPKKTNQYRRLQGFFE